MSFINKVHSLIKYTIYYTRLIRLKLFQYNYSGCLENDLSNLVKLIKVQVGGISRCQIPTSLPSS